MQNFHKNNQSLEYTNLTKHKLQWLGLKSAYNNAQQGFSWIKTSPNENGKYQSKNNEEVLFFSGRDLNHKSIVGSIQGEVYKV